VTIVCEILVFVMPKRRVVITGLGVVSPLGNGLNSSWRALSDGRSGAISINDFVQKRAPTSYSEDFLRQIPSKVLSPVPFGTSDNEFNVKKYHSTRQSLFISYAMEAAEQALKDADFSPQSQDELERVGVAIGSGIGSIEDISHTSSLLESPAQYSGYRKISPFFVPKILVNMAAGNICIKYGFQGPNHSVGTACAASLHSIGDACRFIKYGDADVMLAGGTDAALNPVAISGFCKLRALSTKFNSSPKEASRPFDGQRDGFVIADGAGVVVLEEYEHALKRNAKIYAEVCGYGTSADAHHITTPRDDGKGAALSMKRAINDAGLHVDEIDYINAHATSTPQGDLAEIAAIDQVFDRNVLVSSFKGALGHLLGAAGAVETILAVRAMQEGFVIPTLNLKAPEKAKAHLIDGDPIKRPVRYMLKNSFGFGGTNCSLVLSSAIY
jgi:3-oxoacyl-[acyl-carrier-protein] synthase II